MPSVSELSTALAKSCQLWLISGNSLKITQAHCDVIKTFWEKGNGVYIWGDNDPLYVDANFLAKVLIHPSAGMSGNVPGQKNVGLTSSPNSPGFVSHMITTGFQTIYEGHTIATINSSNYLTPLITGSANNLVTAYSEQGNRRLIIDGGFTRLYDSLWDSVGTGAYVSNCAGWLSNLEVQRSELDSLIR